MYTRTFGLREKPFTISPNPRFLFLSRHHLEALEHLRYGIQERMGFVVVTGEVGTGKTTLLRSLLESISSETDTAFVFNTRITAKQLLKQILTDLGLDAAGLEKDEMVEALNEFLLRQLGASRNTVVVIDEAQNLGAEVLEELRLLSNLETSQAKLLQIVLVGQPELNALLNLPKLRQLRQRITVMYHLQPLSLEETGEYIRHRLRVAGSERDLFTPEAVQGIHYYARGFPRLVNILCDRALLAAYADDKTQVDRPLVDEVQREMEVPFTETAGATSTPDPSAPPGLPVAAAGGNGTGPLLALPEDLQTRLRKLDGIEDDVKEIRATLKNLENLLNFSLWVDRNV
ncbi:MAG: AAA family ATPase [Gemmatimonadetes bacterium]|nr:AAA family ATPase [Gemmatimonadota bacterium]